VVVNEKHHFLKIVGVVFLQLIGTQVITFIASLTIPVMLDFQQSIPVYFMAIMGLTFSLGVFLVGWFALKRSWLASPPRLHVRLAGTVIGAFLPLAAGILFQHDLPAGSPFFGISILASILGFHLPSWYPAKK
jgi:hypothetical protein